MESVAGCLSLVQKTKVQLRGWDFPHISKRPDEREFGNKFFASGAEFMGIVEYWRFYQSGQFLHLSAVREAPSSEWFQKLKQRAVSSIFLKPEGVDLNKAPGFISILNTIYMFTEIFEFAARLSEVGLYDGRVEVRIAAVGIGGFVLVAGDDRAWHEYFHATVDQVDKIWQIDADSLLRQPEVHTLNGLEWFFERFGWINLPKEILGHEIESFRGRRS